MAFVNEKISEEDKMKYRLSKLRRPPLYLDDVHIVPNRWTANKSEKKFLVPTGVGREEGNAIGDITYFSLLWNGQVIDMELKRKFVGGDDAIWQISWIKLPPEIGSKREEILDDLKQALRAYGFSGKDIEDQRGSIGCDF